MRRQLKPILSRIPAVRRYLGEKQALAAALAGAVAERDRLSAERNGAQDKIERLEAKLGSCVDSLEAASAKVEELDARVLDLTTERDNLLVHLNQLKRLPGDELIHVISRSEDLRSDHIRTLSDAVEASMTIADSDKVGVHREIGKAIFARSMNLYSGEGIPENLRRYTYPPVISIALNSHCNAACFFCRESDYKGTTVDFDNIVKLESAIRSARIIDLTGWGEPFFYPRFEDVIKYISSTNTEKQVIQITTNGSFLSEKWGRMLSGKIARLVISLNAATSETYAEQMRYKNDRFTLETVLANITEFQKQLTVEDRKRVILHMVANTGNFREIPDLVRVAHTLNIPVVSVGNYICADENHLDKVLWNVKDEYNSVLSDARQLAATLGVGVWGRRFFVEEKEIKGPENCMAPFEQFFIEMPGTTAPCCFMGAERMGNVYEQGFEAVWFSDVMNRLRHSRTLPPCKVCTVFTPFDNKISHMSAFLTTEKGKAALATRPRRSSAAVDREVAKVPAQ